METLGEPISPHGFDAAFVKLLWPLVFYCTGVGDTVAERTTWRPADDWQVGGVATAGMTGRVGVASSSRDEVLYVAVGVALGVVVVAMTTIVAVCAWRQRQQRRMLGKWFTMTRDFYDYF